MFTQIRIKNIPGIFPAPGYSDLKIVDQRCERLPDAQKDEYITELKYKTIDYPTISRPLKIQSVFRSKYSLQLVLGENTNIDLSKIADTCTITFYDNSEIEVYVLSSEFGRVGNTSMYLVTIVFVHLSEDFESISNYLIKDNIRLLHADSDLHRLTLFTDKTISNEFSALNNEYIIYTKIFPYIFSTDFNEKKTDQSGITYISNSIDFKTLNLLFYLTSDEATLVNRYMPRCNVAYNLTTGIGTVSSSYDVLTFTVDPLLSANNYVKIGLEYRRIYVNLGAGSYQMYSAYNTPAVNASFEYCGIIAEERIIPKLESKDMVELYECKVELKYDIIDFNNEV